MDKLSIVYHLVQHCVKLLGLLLMSLEVRNLGIE